MSSESSEDFLWECALRPGKQSAAESTRYLVPDELDSLANQKTTERISFSTTVTPDIKQNAEDSQQLLIKVTEIRGNGVLDAVGGEVWEASLLLCAYIISDMKRFRSKSLLEIGSGLGLPSQLLVDLHRLLVSCESSVSRRHNTDAVAGADDCIDVCLSDNDPRCLDALIKSIENRYSSSNQLQDGVDKGEGCFRVSVEHLDWTAFRRDRVADPPSNESICNVSEDGGTDDYSPILYSEESVNDSKSVISNDRFDICMGSALCYSPYHACVADVLKYFLAGSCEEAVIIQIADRAGFDLFLDRLQYLGIQHTVEPVSEKVYEMAQKIGLTEMERSVLGVGGWTDASSEHHTDKKKVENISRPHVDLLSDDEGEVRIEKTFVFPPEMVQIALDDVHSANVMAGVPVGVRTMDNTNGDHRTLMGRSECTTNESMAITGVKKGLIKTDREAFVLVRIYKD